MIISIRLKIVFLSLILVSGCCIVSNSQDTLTMNLSDTIPLDRNVRVGKLTNGFRYYIRKNDKPKDKVMMMLAVKAGSVLEDDDQVELAHFLEHMALNGTAHFTSAFEFMAEAGIRVGTEANAFTGNDDTRYFLYLPSDNQKLVNQGLLLLSDFAQSMLLNEDAIDAERGVLQNEIRTGRGYGQRMQDVYWRRLIRGSKYATQAKTYEQRFQNIETFGYESLRRFYHDWYHPDLQGVTVVGDINIDSIEIFVRDFFGREINPDVRREKPSFEVSLDGSNDIIKVADAEMPHTEIVFYMKRMAHPLITYGDLKSSVVYKFYDQMAKMRFDEVSRSYNLPFRNARHFISQQELPGIEVLKTRFEVDSGGVENGMKAVLAEVFRIKKHGFTEIEWKQAQEAIDIDQLVPYGHDSRALANSFIDYFLQNQAAPNPSYATFLVKQILGELTLEDVNNLAKEWIGDVNFDIVILSPDDEKLSIPDDLRVKDIIDVVKSLNLEEYSNRSVGKVLLNRHELKKVRPHPFDKYYHEDVDVVELMLDNGIRVVLKPIKKEMGQDDRVMLYGFADGGSHTYSAKEYASASSAAEIVSHSGVGNFNQFELEDYLSRSGIEISPFIYHDEVGISGTSKFQDIETLMKLVYLYYTSPNISKDAFIDWKNKKRAAIKSGGNSPENLFNEEISKYTCSYGVRKGQMTLNDLEQISFKRIEKLYKQCFQNTGSFTFVIVGTFDVAYVSSLVVSYLGSLPNKAALKRRSAIFREDCDYKPGVIRIVRRGIDPEKATVRLHFSGECDYSVMNSLNLDAMGHVLKKVLTARLREKESGTYGVNSGISYSKGNQNRFIYSVSFICDADLAEKLIDAALDEIEILKSGSVNSRELENFIAAEEKAMTARDSNIDFWKYYLVRQYKEGRDLNEILYRKKLLRNMKMEGVRFLAREILISKNLTRFVLLPESTLNSN